jgi:hypothetical protein
MELHPEELKYAREYTKTKPFYKLTAEQLKAIRQNGRNLYHWFVNHLYLHVVINFLVLTSIFAGDYLLLIKLPGLFFGEGEGINVKIVTAMLLVGLLHGWLIYSLGIFTLHEGAAHQIIFPLKGRIAKILNIIVNNLNRLSFADPVYYAKSHMAHHAHFGEERDKEFVNFVLPHRLWLSLIPYAWIFGFADLINYRTTKFTRSRLLSALLGLCYHGTYGYFMANKYGLVFAIVTLGFVTPTLGFSLNQIRLFTRHNLMPLENVHGARSFGTGFWGLFIGGGPWGQPCHWIHHLFPTIPWYQQIILHHKVARLLTPEQRKQWMLQPIIGFPKLFISILKELYAFEQGHQKIKLRRAL